MSSKFFPAFEVAGKSQADGAFEVFTDIWTNENNGTILDMRATHFQISAHTSAAATAGTLEIAMKTYVNNVYEDLPGTITDISLIGTGMVTISVPNIYLYSLRFTPLLFDADKTYGVVIQQGQM
jgi:hypothetical protein